MGPNGEFESKGVKQTGVKENGVAQARKSEGGFEQDKVGKENDSKKDGRIRRVRAGRFNHLSMSHVLT